MDHKYLTEDQVKKLIEERVKAGIAAYDKRLREIWSSRNSEVEKRGI